MTHLPGLPHLSSGPDRSSEPQTPHESTVRGHASAPLADTPHLAPLAGLPGGSGVAGGGVVPEPPRKPRPSGHLTNTLNAALIPAKDPWGRKRREDGEPEE